MTLEQITHDLASIDRVVYRTDLLRSGIHGWQLGGSSTALQRTLVSYPLDELPSGEDWAEKLNLIRHEHKPSLIMRRGL